VKDEILHINSEARSISLQVALLIPIVAGAIGILNSSRMMKLTDIKPSASLESATLG
jgi:hypothetical protein